VRCWRLLCIVAVPRGIKFLALNGVYDPTSAKGARGCCVCSDNLRTNTEALTQLKRIATALGEARTREELIPFISEPQEDNDEHLLVLAQELGGLLGNVGGSEYGHVLLAPLETLTGSDENAVRDAAVQSIQGIVKDMSKAHVLEYVLPMLSRLTQGCYPQRVAACALCADVQQCVSSEDAAGIRSDFEQLTKDPLPVVRRAAAANLARQAQTASDEHIDSLIHTFVQMAQDGASPCYSTPHHTCL
jgi:serine/threonine-protein phosphatase 2A regulatory subunit A